MKILKSKNFLQLSLLCYVFCVNFAWWQDFAALTIPVFPLPLFSTENPQFLPLVSFKKPSTGLFCKIIKLSIKESLVQEQKLLIGNILIILILLIWYLSIVNMLLFLPIDLFRVSFFFKWCKSWRGIWCWPLNTHTRAYTNKNTHPRKKGTPAVLTEIFIPYKTPFSEPPQSQNLLNHPSALPSSSSAGDKTIKMWI